MKNNATKVKYKNMNFKERSYEAEIMDDLEMEGAELASTLNQIAMVNQWLGGTTVVLSGLKKMWKGLPKGQPIKIIDLGCGGGEILRKIADWGRKNNRPIELIGIDANAFIVDYAQQASLNYPEIQFQQLDVFSSAFTQMDYDIALCSLFLHHFRDEEILLLLKTMKKCAKIGVLINDLQRSRLAHLLFDGVTRVLGASKMVRHDGKLSIRRAFRRSELSALAQRAGFEHFQIQWKWAFRYQAILRSG